MSRKSLPSPVTSIVTDLELTPSGRFVLVTFAPVRVPGAWRREGVPPAHPAPLCGWTRMYLNELLCKDVRPGDTVELELAGKLSRPVVVRVLLEKREVRHG